MPRSKAKPSLPPAAGVYTVPQIQQFTSIISAGSHVFYNLDEALRDSFQNARNMRRDPDIRGPLEARQLATAELPWHLEPEQPKDPYQKRVCDEITADIKAVPSFLRFKRWLLEAIWFGKSATQNLYAFRNVHGKMRLRMIDWEPVNGDTLLRRYDTKQWGVYVGNRNTFGPGTREVKTEPGDRQWAHFLTATEREAFCIHRHLIEAGDFYEPDVGANAINGVGIRSILYWFHYQKAELMGWLMTHCQRSGLGLNVWYFEQGNDASEKKVREAAEAQQNDLNILFPRSHDGKGGAGYERIEPNATGVDNLMRVANDYFNARIKEFILGQTATSEATPSGMNSNVAEVHQNTFQRIVEFDAQGLSECLTTDLVAIFKKWNHPEADFDVRFVIDVEQPDPEKYLDAVEKFVNLGGEADEADVREKLGLPVPDEGAKVLRGNQPQQPVAQMDAGGGVVPMASPGGANAFTPGYGRKKKFAKGDCRWVTTGAQKGEDGKKHGGSKVCIGKGGRIEKGNPKLTGRNIGTLKDKTAPEAGSHRSDLHREKEYRRAVWRKKARKEGISPKHLDELAEQIRKQDKEQLEEKTKMLRDARSYLKNRFGVNANIFHANDRVGEDYSSVRGIDQVAQDAMARYPEVFAGCRDDTEAAEQLLDMLKAGNPKPISEEDAYEQAFQQIKDSWTGDESWADRPPADEPIPFSRDQNLTPSALDTADGSAVPR